MKAGMRNSLISRAESLPAAALKYSSRVVPRKGANRTGKMTYLPSSLGGWGSTFYITKNKGTSANLFTDWEVHSNKNGTNVTPGQAFTDEWGGGQVLPLKNNFPQLLQLGGVGYDQWQVTANTGLDKNAPFYSVHAAGLQGNYILPPKNFSLFACSSSTTGSTRPIRRVWAIRSPSDSRGLCLIRNRSQRSRVSGRFSTLGCAM